ncbi:MAG: T9SS type A sorting domain-containing protein [Owenweeksia sp.]
MKPAFYWLLAGLMVYSFSLEAKRYALVGGSRVADDDPGCIYYHITILEDGGNNDPNDDYVITEGTVSSDGCFDIAPGGGDPKNPTDTKIITTGEDNGITWYKVTVYDDTDALGTGFIYEEIGHGKTSINVKSTTVITVSTEYPQSIHQIRVYPTQVEDLIHVEYLPSVLTRVTVADLQGKTWNFDVQKMRQTETLDLSGFDAGFYILTLTDYFHDHKTVKLLKL